MTKSDKWEIDVESWRFNRPHETLSDECLEDLNRQLNERLAAGKLPVVHLPAGRDAHSGREQHYSLLYWPRQRRTPEGGLRPTYQEQVDHYVGVQREDDAGSG